VEPQHVAVLFNIKKMRPSCRKKIAAESPPGRPKNFFANYLLQALRFPNFAVLCLKTGSASSC
jgi:hypothetical protein